MTEAGGKKKVLVCIRQRPYEDRAVESAIDLAMVAAAFEQEVSVLFAGDGLFNLIKHTSPAMIGKKSIAKRIQALGLYDVDEVYACQDSLDQTAIGSHGCIDGVRPLSSEQVASLFRSADVIVDY